MLTFARLPMGFLNSGYYLAQITDKIKETNHNVCSFVDDLYLVTHSNFKDHCNQLSNLLKTLVDLNLRVKASKTCGAKPGIDVLGHYWALDRFHIPEAKLQGIMDWEQPKSFDQIAKYTGHIGFYRRYTPGLAECLIPLQALSSQGIEAKKKRKIARLTKEKVTNPKYIWTEEHTKAFEQSKELFKKYNTMFPADPSKPYFCYSDASQRCASFVVTQEDDEGNIKLIGASSRKFTRSEISMSVFKKECVAILYGLNTFHDLLSFAKIYLSVDAKSICYLKAARSSDYLLTHWALTMSTFDIEIKHISGEQNILADTLTRSGEEEVRDEDPFLTLSLIHI